MKNYNWYGCGLLIVALACATLSGCETSGTGALSTPSESTASMPASSSKNAGRLIIQRVANLGTGLVLQISIDGKQVATLPRGQTYNGSLSPRATRCIRLGRPKSIASASNAKTFERASGPDLQPHCDVARRAFGLDVIRWLKGDSLLAAAPRFGLLARKLPRAKPPASLAQRERRTADGILWK